MKSIAISGATGFIGCHLVRQLVEIPGVDEIRILTRNRHRKIIPNSSKIKVYGGDLLKRDTLSKFLTHSSTVINLAFLHGHSVADNLRAAEDLAAACRMSKIKKLIHCSTALVVGKNQEQIVTEATQCHPKTAYEKVKFGIEEIIRKTAGDDFEFTIIRPTAVFGVDGKNLLKLAHDLAFGNRWINYIKSCLYNTRKLNLVSATNVSAAIVFLIETKVRIHGEVFIISDDDEPLNNFMDVERCLKTRMQINEDSLPRVTIPKQILSPLLWLAGRSNVNPDRIYSSEKILSLGFHKPLSLKEGLTIFTDWYCDTYLSVDKQFKQPFKS